MVEDFVIVIDTSMSCSGELVRQFLEENVFSADPVGDVFLKSEHHIIQCDDRVREDVAITSAEALKSLYGTAHHKRLRRHDFRPAPPRG